MAGQEPELFFEHSSNNQLASNDAAAYATGTAARWCFRASWQLRALLSRGLPAHVRIPIKSPDGPQDITGLSTLPDLGPLIRPLFFEFTPRTELLRFQTEGVAWLLAHPRAILADDMGLGKTLQVLEAVRTQIYQGVIQTAVVLCPRTLALNWMSESKKWAPELVVATSAAWQDTPETLWSLVADRRIHIAVVHYDQLRTLPEEMTSDAQVQLLILDEAHRVRRSEAAVTSAVRSLRATSIWAISGTPIERDSEDLATILSIIAPEKYTPSVSNLGDRAVQSIAQPLLLRRRKSDVLTELPPVEQQLHYLELTPSQRSAYDITLTNARARAANKGELLKTIADLMNICDLDPMAHSSSKIEDIIARLFLIRQSGEKAVIFSYKLKPLDVLGARIAEANPDLGWLRIDGRMGTEERNTVLTEFRKNPAVVALLASSRIASEGLTLTEANHAFFVNRWWNPSNSDQARDRLVRIGQRRAVVIHFYVCNNTIEERLEEILESKRELVDRVVESLATGLGGSVSSEELADLIT